MPFDYIPQGDGEFDAWQAQYVAYAAAHAAELGFLPAQIAELQAASAQWHSDFTAYNTARATAAAATQTKDGSRSTFTNKLRADTAQMQARPATTDAQRAGLGVSLRRGRGAPVGPPTSAPRFLIDIGIPRQHSITLLDEERTTSRAKPPGVWGCELWHQVGGPPPTTQSGFTFIGLATRSLYLVEYEAEAAGQTVYYRGRWVSKHGAHGPWSRIAYATVGG